MASPCSRHSRASSFGSGVTSASRSSSFHYGFDWIHVRDVIDAELVIHEARDVDGKAVDIGTGRLTSVRDVVSAAAAILDSKDLLKFGVLKDRAGEPLRSADVAATFRTIDWHHCIDLTEGLRETVA